MICNHCFSQIPEGEVICPFCKKRVAQKRFQINIPEEKLNEEFPVEEVTAPAELQEQVEENSRPAFSVEEKAEPEEEPEEVPEEVTEEVTEEEPQKEPEPLQEEKRVEVFAAGSQQKTPPIKAQQAKKPPVTAVKVNSAAQKREKKARAVVLSICSLCAAVMIALTFVSKYTDVFKTENAPVKTVALSGFSHSEKSSFEDYTSFFPAFFKSGFDRNGVTREELLSMMKPQNGDGLYAAFFKPASVVTDKADPAGRFKNGEGYSYCKIKKAYIEKIMSALGFQIVNCSNSRDYYYCDGYYYFAAESAQKQTKPEYTVDVVSSKRTEDGDYYVQCDFTATGGEKKTVYCLVSLEKSDEGNKWSLSELSSQPLFSSDGVKIVSGNEETLRYEINRKSIPVKTAKGILFANYIIEYPVFSAADGDEKGKSAAATLNTLYNDMISKYQTKAKKAGYLYKKFLNNGGKKKDLPAYTYVTSVVVYNKNGYISLIEETNEYIPLKTASEQTGEVAEEDSGPLFPTTAFEAYTLDISTGEFVKKDSVLGKDYVSIQQKLFAQYCLSRGIDESEIPADTENIGQLISASAWSVSPDGVLFSFIDPDGYNDSIVLPYGEIADAELKL